MSFQGLLNSVCNIQQRTKTQNSTTGQVVDSWSIKYGNVPCRLNPLSGSEINSGDTTLATATHMLFLNNNYDLINKSGLYRVKIGTTFYNILAVYNAGGQGHHLELILELKK